MTGETFKLPPLEPGTRRLLLLDLDDAFVCMTTTTSPHCCSGDVLTFANGETWLADSVETVADDEGVESWIVRGSRVEQ